MNRRTVAWTGLFLTTGLLLAAGPGGQTVFFEDFEGGNTGWTMTSNRPEILWHFTQPGECLLGQEGSL